MVYNSACTYTSFFLFMLALCLACQINPQFIYLLAPQYITHISTNIEIVKRDVEIYLTLKS